MIPLDLGWVMEDEPSELSCIIWTFLMCMQYALFVAGAGTMSHRADHP